MIDLKVIECKPKQKPDYATLHFNSMINVIRSLEGDNYDKSQIIKIVNHGVRTIGLIRRDIDKKQCFPELFSMIEAIKFCLAKLTPRELIQIFPVTKTYDGEKWSSKDYFYTMDTLNKHGLDKPIGESLDEILWDYSNDVIIDFYATFMCVASRLYKQQTGIGIMEEFAEKNGIKTMTMCKDERTGKQFLFDKENHRSYAVKKPVPRWLKVIK